MEDRHIVPINISDEMKRSFLDYAMSVIVSRALPDVRDGLKPVHRRILYTMHILKNTPTQPYKKSARVVGDTMGRFHPHGDAAIYDALVRLTQPFSMRYPLVDGQGNFGSIDGDPAAAMRYTEVRMAKIALEMLADIDKDTVDFVPNYDDKEFEPAVLPARLPNLLVNGASGIAVGMATNIPPHNLSEVVDGAVTVLEDPEIDLAGLIQKIHGPDFPTGGIIYGRAPIIEAYKTGRGRLLVRGVVDVEELREGRTALVVTELPYQVNKARLIEKIADLVKNKEIAGISDIRDESDKRGMRVVIMLKRDAMPEVIKNQLFKKTELQTTIGMNLIAIVDGRPKLLSLKEILQHFIEHRRQVVLRRTEYELREAEERREIVEGLGVASMDIDEVIRIIRSSHTPDEARSRLMLHDFHGLEAFLERAGVHREDIPATYRLSRRQAQAILDMRLHRLTGLQQEKLAEEYRELLDRIEKLRKILNDPEELKRVIREELEELKNKYGDERRTAIEERSGEVTLEDIIPNKEMVLTLTRAGYIKRTGTSDYQAQGRGGKGKKGAELRDEDDAVIQVLVAMNHDVVLFFTDTGRVFRRKVYELPEGKRSARGKALVNFLGLEPGERVVAMLSISGFDEGGYLFFATRRGIVKRSELSLFTNIKQSGIKAIHIDDDDGLLRVSLTDGRGHVLLGTRGGLVVRFSEDDVRSMGRTARGVKGISLRGDDEVVSMDVFDPADSALTVLTMSASGYGKRSPVEEFPAVHRGGKGVIAQKVTDRTGALAAISIVQEGYDLLAFTEKGQTIRVQVENIKVQSRNTQGVKIMSISDDDRITDLALVPRDSEDDLSRADSDGETSSDANAEPSQSPKTGENQQPDDTSTAESAQNTAPDSPGT